MKPPEPGGQATNAPQGRALLHLHILSHLPKDASGASTPAAWGARPPQETRHAEQPSLSAVERERCCSVAPHKGAGSGVPRTAKGQMLPEGCPPCLLTPHLSVFPHWFFLEVYSLSSYVFLD